MSRVALQPVVVELHMKKRSRDRMRHSLGGREFPIVGGIQAEVRIL